MLYAVSSEVISYQSSTDGPAGVDEGVALRREFEEKLSSELGSRETNNKQYTFWEMAFREGTRGRSSAGIS